MSLVKFIHVCELNLKRSLPAIKNAQLTSSYTTKLCFQTTYQKFRQNMQIGKDQVRGIIVIYITEETL